MDATDAEVDLRREIQQEEIERGKAKVKREELEAEEEDAEEDKKRRVSVFSSALGKKGGIGGNNARYCQAEKCLADMNGARQYHRRHKVCEHHAKAQVVLVGGIRQRFCQQCSRFHEISEFDETKRSCRRRLAGHNDRRRKISADISSNRDCSRVNSNDKILSDQIS